LAADTPVFPGGAVVFSLALSLAELFEKAMEGERERETCVYMLTIWERKLYRQVWKRNSIATIRIHKDPVCRQSM
jgi:hypothetical protein